MVRGVRPGGSQACPRRPAPWWGAREPPGSTTRDGGPVQLHVAKVRVPLTAVVGAWCARRAAAGVGWLARRPLAVAVLVAVVVLWRVPGTRVPVLGVAVVAALALGVWRARWPASFTTRVVWRARGCWRAAWVYRYHWQPAMVTTGLAVRVDGTEYLPRIARGPLHRVGGPGPGADAARPDPVEDWAAVADRLAQTFGAVDGRVRIRARPAARAGAVVPHRRPAHRSPCRRSRPPTGPRSPAGLPVARREDGHDLAAAAAGHARPGGRRDRGREGVGDLVAPAALAPAIRDRAGAGVGGGPQGRHGAGRRPAPCSPGSSTATPHGSDRVRAEFAELLEDAVAVMRRRQDRLRGRDPPARPDLGEPLIVVVVDELAVADRVRDRPGRQAPDRRRPGPAAVPGPRGRGRRWSGRCRTRARRSLPMRDLFPTRIALRLTEAEQVDLVLGPGARDRGARCDRIPDDAARASGYVGHRRRPPNPSGSASPTSPTTTSPTWRSSYAPRRRRVRHGRDCAARCASPRCGMIAGTRWVTRLAALVGQRGRCAGRTPRTPGSRPMPVRRAASGRLGRTSARWRLCAGCPVADRAAWRWHWRPVRSTASGTAPPPTNATACYGRARDSDSAACSCRCGGRRRRVTGPPAPGHHRRRSVPRARGRRAGLRAAGDATRDRPGHRRRRPRWRSLRVDPGARCPPCAHKARRAADAAVRRRLAPHRRTRDAPSRRRPGRRPATTGRRRSTTRPTATSRSSVRRGGCGRPGAGRTPRTCPGCRWRTAPSAGRSPPRTGRTYRPIMFLTLTLPVLRAGRPGTACRSTRRAYDYRRAALDAMHFPKLVDRWWQNLRRCAGYKVQYFSAVEPQRRLAPHLHAAIRGAIPRATIRAVDAGDLRPGVVAAASTSPSTSTPSGCRWWDRAARLRRPRHRLPLPTWEQALAWTRARGRPRDAGRRTWCGSAPRSTSRASSPRPPDADRAVRYLTKYLTKSVADTYADDDDEPDPRTRRTSTGCTPRSAWLPCSPGCANWLRYGVQPKDAGPGLIPGRCPSKAHDRENLGLGGRRVLVSRKWSGKTLTEHRADRAEVVRADPRGRRHRRPGDRTGGRRRPRRGRPAAVRLGRRAGRPAPATPTSCSPPSPSAALARPVRARPTGHRHAGHRPRACGQPFGNHAASAPDASHPWSRVWLSGVSEANHAVTRSALDRRSRGLTITGREDESRHEGSARYGEAADG